MIQQEKLHRDRTVDPDGVALFDKIGANWWDPRGPMAALHRLNPARVAYLRDLLARRFGETGAPPAREPLQDLRILDIGCGGGILSESLAKLGAEMTSIDPAPHNIEIAREHAAKSHLSIDYRRISVEELSAEGASFDAVLAMEVVEHVRDVPGFLRHAASMVRPDGVLVVATLNRTLKSFALAIVGAEYILRWAPRGTHKWSRFITPLELAQELRAAGLHIIDEIGVVYDPIADAWRLSRNMDVNYMIAADRRA